MRNALIFGAVMVAAGVVACGAQSHPGSLSLAQVLQDIETVNLGVLTNREFIAQAEQNVRVTRSSSLPRLDVSVQQSRGQRANSSAIRNLANNFEAGVIVSATLLDFQQFDNLRAARQAVDVSRFDFESAVQEVMSTVAALYFEHLRNLAFDAVIDSNIDRAEQLLELARNQFEAGVATQIEVTRAEAELVVRQQAKLQQETLILSGALRLKRLLNLDLATELALQDFSFQRELGAALATQPIDEILEQRPDFQAELALLEQRRLTRRSIGRERVPSVGVFGQAGYNTEVVLDGDEREFWTVGVRLDMPIFDGSRISASEQIAESRIRQQEFAIESLRDTIESEWRIAVQDVQSQLAQTAVAEKNLALADEEQQLARIRYEQGVADNRELIEAENRYTLGRFNLVNATYDYYQARVELARVRGDVRLILQEQVP